MKKILMIGVAFISLFFMFGCKKDDGNNKNIMSKEEFYEKLVVLDQNSKNVKQYTVTGDTKVSAFMMSETIYHETTIDLENNRYADVSKDKDGNISESEYVVKNGENYISYRYSVDDYIDNNEETYEAYYVGSDYVSMAINEGNVGLDQLDLSSFENFSKSFDGLFEKMFAEEGLEDMPSLEPVLEIYEQKGIYYFVYSLEVKNYEMEDNMLGIEKLDLSAKSELKFDEEFIVSLNMSYKITYHMGESGKMSMSMAVNANYSKGFKESIMISDFSSYPTNIEPASFEITYIIDGEETYVWFDDNEYLKGETFVVDYDEEVENATIDGWYLDPNCTININTLTDYPSYDITIYANTKPNEGYGLVILKGTVDSDGWKFHIDVEKQAILANQTYTIPSVVEAFGDEGIVTSVKVNGVTYTEDEITIENSKVYIVEVEAIAIEE